MDRQDEIINKIKAAMRLARRAGTDGEKAAAEAAARRLANKAGIALSEIETTDAEIRTEQVRGDKWFCSPGIELGYITSVLRKHFGIVLMQERMNRHTRLVWIGTAINIQVAQYVYEILLRECTRAWNEARVIRSKYQYYYSMDPHRERQLVALRNLNKKAFLDGWFFEIHRKLTEHPLRNDLEQFKAEKRDAEEFLAKLKEEHNISEKKTRRTGKNDQLSVRLGFEAAGKVNLSRPCDNAPVQARNTIGATTGALPFWR